jgi:hypothetical protein
MLRHASTKGVGKALTVQLLGTVDDKVGPDDNLDLVTGEDFVYLEVPQSGHSSVVEIDDSEAGSGRRAVFLAALDCEQAVLQVRGIQPIDLLPQPPRPEVTDVVFVVHGIRDTGFWTQRIATRVQALGRADNRQRIIEKETSTYGYFPFLPFLLSKGRQGKVEWLMDQYTENLALYPNADFSFVGHSNGTYLLAKALEDYPSCHFKHVVFAGSVVQTRYDWTRMIEEKRVRAILNYVATRDLTVAMGPKAFEMLHLQDLGSAGHDGFRIGTWETESSEGKARGGQFQIRYIRGGHSAAVKEVNWDAIAAFVVDGTVVQPPAALQSKRRVKVASILGLAAPVGWLLLVTIFALGFVGLWWIDLQEWLRTLAVVLYIVALWAFWTKL